MEHEIRAVLTKEKYDELNKLFNDKYNKILDDKSITEKFRMDAVGKDIRIRYSENISEMVIKSNDPTNVSRLETSIYLKSAEDCKKMIEFLGEAGLKQDPPWLKTKQEFEMIYNGKKYVLSLQHIEKFAYILEVELQTENFTEEHLYEMNQILRMFGCSRVDANLFKKMIKEYINTHQKS
ncbi:hypothetical protein KO465_01775 [Candidatus Micrarchaeota archaeon]|nr:hypothetical protein [Candidatus Micrarchaeota archaeon]